jgi:signal transduction histidine kinase
VVAHGGHIHIDSVRDEHTTFTLDVPQHPYTVSAD